MALENNSSDIDLSTDISEVPIPRTVRLLLLVLFDIPSLTCAIFVLFNLLKNRLLRESLHNHVIIVLLFSVLPTHLIDIPFHIIYLSLGYVWPSNSVFCLFWSFISVGIFDTTEILMGYASIERHILVFHDQWLTNLKRRLYLHYIPLFTVLMYSLIFYTYVIFFPPCINNFDYTKVWCSYPCYYDNEKLSMYDTIVNTIFPTLVVFTCNLTLVLRVIFQKRRFVGRAQWKKYRRMVIQLLAVSSLLIIFNFPLIILILAHLCGLSSDVGIVFEQYSYFFTYFIPLLLPFVCLGSSPEIYKKLTKLFISQWQKVHLRRTRTIEPKR
jgi:hypothetical protein